jgi:hypothetical protein
MFSAISAIATVTVSGITGTVASTGWLWLLFFMAVPLLLVSWRTPDTYHTAGLERGDRHLNFHETRDNLAHANRYVRSPEDKAMRTTQRYGDLVQRLTWSVESDHPVTVTVTSKTTLGDREVHAWFGAVASAAGRVASGGPTEEVWWEANVATVHPARTPLTKIHVGPSLSGDAWPRLAERLVQKAGQTSGGPPAWIRVEVDESLFALTSLAMLEPEARLRALAGNVAIALVDAPHVLGVVLGPPHGIGSGGDERLLLPSAEYSARSGLVPPVVDDRAAASGPTVVRCDLPGGWRRTTFVLPNPACNAEDPLRPGTILAVEGGWLDWALDRLGMLGTAALVR